MVRTLQPNKRSFLLPSKYARYFTVGTHDILLSADNDHLSHPRRTSLGSDKTRRGEGRGEEDGSGLGRKEGPSIPKIGPYFMIVRVGIKLIGSKVNFLANPEL